MQLRCHFREPDCGRLMLDQYAPALHVVLDVLCGALESRNADAEVLRGLDDAAGARIMSGATRDRIILREAVIARDPAILEHHFAVVHEATAERLVAAHDGEPGRAARNEEARGPLFHGIARPRVGIDDVELGVVTVAHELL